MRVEVIVPFTSGGCQHRARAWEWLKPRYRWPVTVAPGPAPWCKALAVMPAVAASTADIVVVADADVWADGLQAAIDEVVAGAAWAIPHRGVHRLTKASTARFIAGAPLDGLELTERGYLGVPGGGIVVAPRELLLAVPLDPRFVGWGQEDEALGVALQTMTGAPWRSRTPLAHLWHPPPPRLTRRRGSHAGWALWERYSRAEGDPIAMDQLLKEARDALPAHQPAVHDHAAR